MNPILVEVIAYFLQKAILEAGRGISWAKVQEDIEKKVDDMVPGLLADKVANYVIEVLIGMVSEKLAGYPDPTAPDIIMEVVGKAQHTLIGKIVMDLFEAKK